MQNQNPKGGDRKTQGWLRVTAESVSYTHVSEHVSGNKPPCRTNPSFFFYHYARRPYKSHPAYRARSNPGARHRLELTRQSYQLNPQLLPFRRRRVLDESPVRPRFTLLRSSILRTAFESIIRLSFIRVRRKQYCACRRLNYKSSNAA